jgi:hypothetical protein
MNEDINPDEYNFHNKYHLDSVSIDISNDGIQVKKQYFVKDTGRPLTVIHKGKDLKNDIPLLWDMLEIDLQDKRGER